MRTPDTALALIYRGWSHWTSNEAAAQGETGANLVNKPTTTTRPQTTSNGTIFKQFNCRVSLQLTTLSIIIDNIINHW